jgi:hypothetical protein
MAMSDSTGVEFPETGTSVADSRVAAALDELTTNAAKSPG